MRVADADRESVVTLLREHCVDGRLTLEEFSARLDEAYSARTKGELELAVRDLPAARPVKKQQRAFMLTPASR